jgi:hypothetical protein
VTQLRWSLHALLSRSRPHRSAAAQCRCSSILTAIPDPRLFHFNILHPIRPFQYHGFDVSNQPEGSRSPHPRCAIAVRHRDIRVWDRMLTKRVGFCSACRVWSQVPGPPIRRYQVFVPFSIEVRAHRILRACSVVYGMAEWVYGWDRIISTQVLKPDEEQELLNNQRKFRPNSPHLTI